jgi:predicted CXXCH cytochrome family protein
MYVQRLPLQRIVTVSAVIIACSLLPRFGQADPGFSFGDETLENKSCLSCHKDKKLVGVVNQINTKAFQHTTHAQLGCKTCHNTISDIHPKDGKTARTTTCSDCHADIATQYSISKHSLSVTNCSACHNPHTVHKPGEVYALDLNKTCTSCHNQDRITASHAQWLPQTNLHLGSITCITCHTKSDNYVLSVYVSRRDLKKTSSGAAVADYSYLKTKAGSEDITKLVDRNLDSYISIEELRNFNSNPANKDLYLKAVLTPAKTTHAFQTSDKSWNCTACHAAGPDAAQVSRLVLPKQDGTFQHLNIEKGASIAALNVIPDFYMMGSSRNTIMNMLGAVILAGGMVMPVGHGFIRFLTRKNRNKE